MNILITGASRGIGAELVMQLANESHHVLAVGRNQKILEQLRNTILSTNPQAQVTILPYSITDAIMTSKLAEQVNELVPHLDALVNNAGFLVNKPFEAILPDDLQQVYEVNVFAPFRLTQALLPALKRSSQAHIVNISSMGGVQGSAKFAGLSAYSSAKAALAGWSEVLAEELKSTGVRVNCLALGAAQTEMLEEAFPGYKAPLTAKEMAAWIAWFTVNGQRFFNGKILPVAVSTP